MGNYVDEGDVREFKIDGCYVDLDNYSSTELTAEISLVEEIIEDITNDIFYTKTETNLFDGTGHTKLFFFPLIPYQLITVTTLKELDLDGSTVLDTFTENEDFKLYDYYVETARTFGGDSPRRRFGTGGVWPKGQNNIQIAGTWGLATTPNTIKRVVTLLILENLNPGSTNLQRTDIAEAEWDDFKIGFQKSSKVGDSTGFPYLDRLLRNYINDISMFQIMPELRQVYEDPATLG